MRVLSTLVLALGTRIRGLSASVHDDEPVTRAEWLAAGSGGYPWFEDGDVFVAATSGLTPSILSTTDAPFHLKIDTSGNSDTVPYIDLPPGNVYGQKLKISWVGGLRTQKLVIGNRVVDDYLQYQILDKSNLFCNPYIRLNPTEADISDPFESTDSVTLEWIFWETTAYEEERGIWRVVDFSGNTTFAGGARFDLSTYTAPRLTLDDLYFAATGGEVAADNYGLMSETKEHVDVEVWVNGDTSPINVVVQPSYGLSSTLRYTVIFDGVEDGKVVNLTGSFVSPSGASGSIVCANTIEGESLFEDFFFSPVYGEHAVRRLVAPLGGMPGVLGGGGVFIPEPFYTTINEHGVCYVPSETSERIIAQVEYTQYSRTFKMRVLLHRDSGANESYSCEINTHIHGTVDGTSETCSYTVHGDFGEVSDTYVYVTHDPSSQVIHVHCDNAGDPVYATVQLITAADNRIITYKTVW